MFKKKKQIWINIDVPTKKFTLHHDCQYTEKIKETPFKGVKTLKRDGGWLQVDSLSAAENLFENSYSHYTFVEHC
ncbi:hypothetical protein V7114_22260 [Neobacillus niacini]|uniref:hypothetical protein n=1 Tax=Neobacillus niacini TaxID=86668 RepID=UPI002FFFF749